MGRIIFGSIIFCMFLSCAVRGYAGNGVDTVENKSRYWHLKINEVQVVAKRPMKEIGVQKTNFDSLQLKENISLSMADILTYN